jgi:hypothetical protein
MAMLGWLAVFAAALALGWAEVEVDRGVSPFGSRIPITPLKKYLPWVGILASLAGIVLLLLGAPFSSYGIAMIAGWMLARLPQDFAQLRRGATLEDLVEAWWRKEISEQDLKLALAEHRLDQPHYDRKRTDLRRRFGADFMQAFEVRFGFMSRSAGSVAAQPIG